MINIRILRCHFNHSFTLYHDNSARFADTGYFARRVYCSSSSRNRMITSWLTVSFSKTITSVALHIFNVPFRFGRLHRLLVYIARNSRLSLSTPKPRAYYMWKMSVILTKINTAVIFTYSYQSPAFFCNPFKYNRPSLSNCTICQQTLLHLLFVYCIPNLFHYS